MWFDVGVCGGLEYLLSGRARAGLVRLCGLFHGVGFDWGFRVLVVLFLVGSCGFGFLDVHSFCGGVVCELDSVCLLLTFFF